MGLKPVILCTTQANGISEEIRAATEGIFDVQPVAAPAGSRQQFLAAVRQPLIVAVVVEQYRQHRARIAETIDLLSELRALRPGVRRLLVTDEDDLSAMIHFVHSGVAHGILFRPLKAEELRLALRPSSSTSGQLASATVPAAV